MLCLDGEERKNPFEHIPDRDTQPGQLLPCLWSNKVRQECFIDIVRCRSEDIAKAVDRSPLEYLGRIAPPLQPPDELGTEMGFFMRRPCEWSVRERVDQSTHELKEVMVRPTTDCRSTVFHRCCRALPSPKGRIVQGYPPTDGLVERL